MIEIKYLKDLPCKQINTNCNQMSLAGGDLYVDCNGSRFVFLGFKNLNREPCFSLYLELKQYDSSGILIKTSKFRFPSIYAPKGLYVTEEPIPVERECNGCEVYISYADFANHIFFEDKLVSRSANILPPKFTSVPQTPGITPTNGFNIGEVSNTVVSEVGNIEETKDVEIKNEAEVTEETSTLVEEPKIELEQGSLEPTTIKRVGKLKFFAPIISALAALGIGFFLIYSFSKILVPYMGFGGKDLFDLIKALF